MTTYIGFPAAKISELPPKVRDDLGKGQCSRCGTELAFNREHRAAMAGAELLCLACAHRKALGADLVAVCQLSDPQIERAFARQKVERN